MHRYQPVGDPVSSSGSYKAGRPAAVYREQQQRRQFFYQSEANYWNEYYDYYGRPVYNGFFEDYRYDFGYEEEEDNLLLNDVILEWGTDTPPPQAQPLQSGQEGQGEGQDDEETLSCSSNDEDEDEEGEEGQLAPFTPPLNSWDRWDCTNEQLRDATRLCQLRDYLTNPPAPSPSAEESSSTETLDDSFDRTQTETEAEEA